MNKSYSNSSLNSSINPNNLEKTIQTWVELDNEIKRINEKVKDLRSRKNDVEDKIMTHVENNDMNNSFINITDGYRVDGFKTDYLAVDALHPSKLEYTKWAIKLTQQIVNVFSAGG